MNPLSLNYNPLDLSESELQEKLCTLFDGQEWESYWALFRKPMRDYSPFVTDSIIIILRNCLNLDSTLSNDIEIAKTAVKRYQKGHLTYYWPIKEGKSVFETNNLFVKIAKLSLSPDADDSSLQQLVLSEKENVDKLIKELEYHRAGTAGFPLCQAQNRLLEKTDGSFIAFFPRYEGFSLNSREAVDLGTDMHILWLLKEFGKESTKGFEQTLGFVRRAVESEIIVRDPFIVSPYYGNASLLQYIIARAIVWGKIEELSDLKPVLLKSTHNLRINNISDLICILSTGLLWNDRALVKKCMQLKNDISLEMNTVCLAPSLHTVPFLLPLARKKAFQMKIYSEAYLLAMTLWIKNALK